MPRLLARVLPLEEQPHLDGRQRRMLEPRAVLDVVRARRPGEVVDVFLVIAVGRRAVRALLAAALGAGGPDDPSRRHREPHVVGAEVREELGDGVKLVAVPAAVLEHADLGEPLRDEEEVADRPGARERPGDVRRPGEPDVDRLAGSDRAIERHLEHGAIVGVAVVGRDVAQARGQIGAVAETDARHVDPAPVGVPASGRVRIAGDETALAHPRGRGVAPGVVIEMKAEGRGRDRGRVAPRQSFVAGQQPLARIQARVDRVARVSRGARLCRDRLCRSVHSLAGAGRHQTDQTHQGTRGHAPILHQNVEVDRAAQTLRQV